jgi:hypothetical protein
MSTWGSRSRPETGRPWGMWPAICFARRSAWSDCGTTRRRRRAGGLCGHPDTAGRAHPVSAASEDKVGAAHSAGVAGGPVALPALRGRDADSGLHHRPAGSGQDPAACGLAPRGAGARPHSSAPCDAHGHAEGCRVSPEDLIPSPQR